MERQNKRQDSKIQFINCPNGEIEIRYFDDSRDSRYLSWIVPRNVADDLISWWKDLRKKRHICFPITMKTKVCNINMPTDKYIDIIEFDRRGRPKMTGWSLPRVAVEELMNWDGKEK